PESPHPGPDDPAPAGAPTDAVITPDGGTELRLMTPEHAAPEQIRQQPVTTATDVWALGALLYQLVTGRKPFPADGSTRRQLEHSICASAPEPPSVVAQRGGGSGIEARRLRGDLDAVVLHALAKAPEDRYGSAEQLADDVRRHLRRQPVRVRPATLRYRGGRFLRRFAWQSAAATVLVALVLAFAVSSALQSRALQRERDAARLDQETAEQVTGVLVDLFETTDPIHSPDGRSMTVEELLDGQSDRVIDGLEGHGAVQARLRHILGKVHTAHSRFDRARELLQAALDQQAALSGWEDPTTLAVHHDLATLEADFGDRLRGLEMLRRSLDLHRAAVGDNHPSIPICLEAVANRLPPASPERSRLLDEALEKQRRLEPEPGLGTAQGLNHLGMARLAEDRLDEALAHFRESSALVERELGADHPFAVAVRSNLSATLTRLNRFEEEEQIDRRNVERAKALYGPESTAVAKTLNNLGTTLSAAGRWAESEVALAETLALFRRLVEPGHPELGNTARNLAFVLEFQGRFADARRLLEDNPVDPGVDPRGAALTSIQLAGLELRRGATPMAVARLEALAAEVVDADPAFDIAVVGAA
ncbi:MAG: tetratricopeptide repeat-containing protein kinase family protein, partial [Acidobacteriota bacterium]